MLTKVVSRGISMSFVSRCSQAGRAVRRAALWPHLFLTIAFIATALRAVVPAGYMIGADPATGRIAIIVCTGVAQSPAAGEHAGHHGNHHGGGGDTQHTPSHDEPGPCAFASFSQLFGSDALPPSLAIVDNPVSVAAWPAPFLRRASQRVAAPPPSRAPPLHL